MHHAAIALIGLRVYYVLRGPIGANPGILALTPVGGWLLQRFAILPEEAYLERKFGSTYRAYKSRVRRWI